MKILILGAGQVGRTAADHLSREEANEVTVVDLNEEVLRDLQDRLDVRTVAGNAAHPTVLESAGAAEADIIVALTSSDEVNMMACEVAFTLFRTPTKIARIRAADYTERAALFGVDGLSVDVFINPEQLVTEYVERLIYHPGALQVLEFADGKVRLVGVRAQRGGLLVGQSLRELARHLPKVAVRVVAIYRDGRAIAPEGDTVVAEGDEIFFLAARNDIRRVMEELRHGDDPARRIVIAGGGNIGFRLARSLESHNQVKLIERDARRARRIAELLESAIVLHGDAADEELLIEENIDSADVFAALTNSEEANILSAMLAKRLGAAKAIALISKPSYTELVESSSIDIAISPQTITIGSVLAVAHVLGLLLATFALAYALPVGCSLVMADGLWGKFLLAAALTAGCGLLLAGATLPFRRGLKARDGFLLLTLGWLLLPGAAALPLLLALPDLSFTGAFFEAMSGLTTTGSTVLNGLDQLPPSLNFWRHSLHWFGGLGVIVMALAVLPVLGVGGMQLYKGQAPGAVKHERLAPRITETAKSLWLVYALITLAGIAALRIGGMSWFDAICHAFSAVGLGGFSTHDRSIAYFGSPAIEAVLIVLMLIASLNFGRHFIALRRLSLESYQVDPGCKARFALLG